MAIMIVIACPICLQRIRAPESVIGRQIKCPQCKNAFTAADPGSIPTDASAIDERLTESGAVDPAWGTIASPEMQPAENRSSGSFVDYLVFRRMVTPAIIVAVFYLGAALILLGGLIYGIIGLVSLFGRNTALLGLLSILVAFFSTVVSLVMWRVFCEVLISLFRIHDNVREINAQLKSKDQI